MVAETVHLSIELLTPAFVGSVAGKQRIVDPHMPLRPSSLRGALRWWFRAAAAAVLWPEDPSAEAHKRMLDALRDVESQVFGSTARRSPFAVLPPTGGRIMRYPIPDERNAPGLRYLGYGLFENRDPPEALVTDRAAPVKLSFRFRRAPEAVHRLFHATLWLFLHLGGIGARSRRGFGSMRVVRRDNLLWPDRLLQSASSVEQLIKRLDDGLDWALGEFREHLRHLTEHPLEHGRGPHPAIRTLDGIGPFTRFPLDPRQGHDILEWAGCLFRDFRSTLRRNNRGDKPLADYFAVKASLDGGPVPADVARAAFGLPLPFYFRSRGGAKTTFVPEHHSRLASPLHFRVHAIDNSTAHFQMILFLFNLSEVNGANPLLGAKLMQHSPNQSARTVTAPDGKILQDFIDWTIKEAGRTSPPGANR